MKKLLLLLLFTVFFSANAQCPAPTYFIVVENIDNSVTLDWTENGSAMEWEIGAVANYQIGDPPPTVPISVTAGKPYVIVAIPPECTVFYVRSLCIGNGVSEWAMVASSECPEGIFDFVNSLSTDDFANNSKKDLLLYPNPAQSFLSIKSNFEVDKIIISDLTGKVISTKTNSTQIDLENLSKGMYIIEVFSPAGKVTKKFIKE